MRSKLLLAVSLAAAALFSHQAVWADPPSWAPAHGHHASHRYVYYPEREIYYAPDRDLWFWVNGGNWSVGSRLPVIYQAYTVGGVSIDLDVARPYDRHVYVIERYGKPKGKKVKYKDHKHHKHDKRH